MSNAGISEQVADCWARSHEHAASVAAMVSGEGKLFCLHDEGISGIIVRDLPERWALHARDAFSGVVLWKRPIPRWEDHLRPFSNGPPELSRAMVATERRVFVTLGQRAPVTAIDSATGDIIQQYPETDGTEVKSTSETTFLDIVADPSDMGKARMKKPVKKQNLYRYSKDKTAKTPERRLMKKDPRRGWSKKSKRPRTNVSC